MSVQKKLQINVGVDFEKGRGYGEVGLGLPDNFLKGEKSHVCGTIAMLFLHPNVDDEGARANKLAQAMSMLSLYAGGFAVTLTKQQFRLLERRVGTYASYMRAPHFDGTFNGPMSANGTRAYSAWPPG